MTEESTVTDIKQALSAVADTHLSGLDWDVQRLGTRSVALRWENGPNRATVAEIVLARFGPGCWVDEERTAVRFGPIHEPPRVLLIRTCSPEVRFAAMTDTVDGTIRHDADVEKWAVGVAREVDRTLEWVDHPDVVFPFPEEFRSVFEMVGKPRNGSDRDWLARATVTFVSFQAT